VPALACGSSSSLPESLYCWLCLRDVSGVPLSSCARTIVSAE
jgi:hypothetical protein